MWQTSTILAGCALAVLLVSQSAQAAQITLAWNPPAQTTGIATYEVYRRTLPATTYPQTPLTSVPAGTHTATDATAPDGGQVCYVVKAAPAAGAALTRSGPSNEACGGQLVAPTSLRLSLP